LGYRRHLGTAAVIRAEQPLTAATAESARPIVGYIAYNAQRIRCTFGRYLSDRVVATLLERVTILTADLQSFTAIAEDADAPDGSPFLPLSNIKSNLLAFDREGLPELSEDTYAKILTLGDRDN